MKPTSQNSGKSVSEFTANPKDQNAGVGQGPKLTVKSHLFKKKSTNNSDEQNENIKPTTPVAQPVRDQTNVAKGLPLTSTVSKNVPGRLSDTSRNFGSPIPCGDSFFEDDAVLTQTHADFMAKFKRHSLPGSTNTSNCYSDVSSPTANFNSPIIKGQDARQQYLKQTSNSSVIYGQKKTSVLNQSDSFISPNRYKPNSAAGSSFSQFDSIDDDMNLELAEQSEFDFDYKISSAAHPTAKKSTEKGSNFDISIDKGDNFNKGDNYMLDQSGEDMLSIDDFGDEDFAEVLEYDNLPTISHTSRASTGSAGKELCFN